MIRELNSVEIDRLLHDEVIGRLGCYADGRVYVVPVGYLYHEGALLIHTGQGMKLEMIRENPQVCFQVDKVDDILNWQSAILWGTVQELVGPEAESALKSLTTKLSPNVKPNAGSTSGENNSAVVRQILSKSSRHGVVLRIIVQEKTGRREDS